MAMKQALTTAYLAKWLIVACVTLSVVLGGVWVASSAVARHLVGQQLGELGLGSYKVKDVSFDPFSSLLTLSDFSLSEGTAKAFVIGSVRLRVHWLNPFVGRFRIDQVFAERITASFTSKDGHLYIGSENVADVYTQLSEYIAMLDDSVSQVSLPEVIIGDSRVEYHLGNDVQVFDLSSLRVTDAALSSSVQHAKLEAEGLFQGGTVFIQSEVSLQNGHGVITSDLTAKDLDLVLIEPYLQQSNLNVKSGLFSVRVKPRVTVRDGIFDISFGDLKLELKRLDMKVERASDVGH